MMSNPLDGMTARKASNAPFAGMEPGDTRVHCGTGRHYGRDPVHVQITRTARPFIHDWVDSTNKAREEQLAAVGRVWIVVGNEPQLVSVGSMMAKRYFGG